MVTRAHAPRQEYDAALAPPPPRGIRAFRGGMDPAAAAAAVTSIMSSTAAGWGGAAFDGGGGALSRQSLL